MGEDAQLRPAGGGGLRRGGGGDWGVQGPVCFADASPGCASAGGESLLSCLTVANVSFPKPDPLPVREM